MVKRQRGLLFDPGTRFSYTNTGYILLAEVVRAASGKTLRQFAEERIFRPLGMDDTLVRDDAGEVVPRRAQRSEEHTSELQSLMRISYAVLCLKKKTHNTIQQNHNHTSKHTN